MSSSVPTITKAETADNTTGSADAAPTKIDDNISKEVSSKEEEEEEKASETNETPNPTTSTTITNTSTTTTASNNNDEEPIPVSTPITEVPCDDDDDSVNNNVENSKHRKPGLTAKGDQRQFVKHCYHDRSQEDIEVLTSSDENTLRLYREDNVGGPFPIKLQILLKVMEQSGKQHIVSWLPHGRSFMIHRPHEFEDEIMQKFFKQTKLTSFRRQLNLYDFQRITHGRDAGSYYHELFLRGKPLLAKRMVRRKVKGTKIRASSSPDDEPNFYSMPFMGPISTDGPHKSGSMAMMNQFQQVGNLSGTGNMMPGMNDGSMPPNTNQYNMNNQMAFQLQQQAYGSMPNQFQPGSYYPGFFNPSMFGMMNFPQQNYQGAMEQGGNNGQDGGFDYFSQMASMHQRNNVPPSYGIPGGAYGMNMYGSQPQHPPQDGDNSNPSNPNYPSPSRVNYPNQSLHHQNAANFSTMSFNQQQQYGGYNGGQAQMPPGAMMYQPPPAQAQSNPPKDSTAALGSTKDDNEEKQNAIEQLLSLQKDGPSQSTTPTSIADTEVKVDKSSMDVSKEDVNSASV